MQEIFTIEEPSKKEQILKASLDIFSKKGFPQTTMREIAKKADVSLGLIYFYFKSKDDILKEIFNRINNTFPKEEVENHAHMTPNDFIRGFCESHLKFMARNFRYFMLLLMESMDNSRLGEFLFVNGMQKGLEDIGKIFHAYQSGSKIRKMNNEFLTYTLLNSIFMFVIFKEGPFKKFLKGKTYEEYARHLSDVLLNGIQQKA